MRCVLEYLEETSKKYPQKIAVVEEDKQETYDDLLTKSKIIGSRLLKYSRKTEPIVVFMDKGILALEVFFGITYTGAFYTLINPEFPDSRIKSMIDTLKTDIIITNEQYKERATSVFNDKNVLLIEDLIKGKIDEESLSNIRESMIDYDPLYLNFTSGSTGTPKGVLISHRSVLDFIDTFTETFNINTTDIIANQAPFDFDVSVKDIYSCIKVGATLVIIPRAYFSKPAILLDYLCQNQATTLIWATSALCLITTFHGLDYKVPTSVKKIFFSGEVMPIKHLNNWMEHLPNTTFVNLYGPTEITCNCTYHMIDRNRVYESIPIGKPFLNERIILLSDNELVTDGVGEICVIGSSLGLGYYNNKEETDKHFMQNPLNDKYIEYIYRTGDLGEIINGEIYFKGRKDFQIKYMGHRIELEEIERAMMKINEVKRAICTFDEEKSKLYGFYTGNIEKESLYEALKKDLPTYMIPTILKQVDEFELNKNGKIDRKKLKELVR